MKKLLIATTALVAGASAAAADVTISGYGRFGLQYVEDRGLNQEDTVISTRLRLTINATTETDVGVTFGARLRFQHDDGAADGATSGNAAQFSVAYEGLKVQVGNVDTAADSVALTYDSELGYEKSSYGDSFGGFFAYNSKPAAGLDNYTGIAASYSVSGVNLYFSYVDPNQVSSLSNPLAEEEIGIAADWTNGQITVAGSYTSNAAGIDNYDHFFLGGGYNFGDGNVGLNYYNFDIGSTDYSQVTLYGNYTFGATTLRAYVSDLDVSGADTAYGIGADYSLGEGAYVAGAIQSGFAGETVADLGVRFDF